MRGIVGYSLNKGAIRGFKNNLIVFTLAAGMIVAVGGSSLPLLWSQKALALSPTGLTSTAPNPGTADTCDWSSSFDVTSHVDAASTDRNQKVVVKITADPSNPAPVQVQWNNPAFGATTWHDIVFTSGVGYYDPVHDTNPALPTGFPLHDGETTHFKVKFTAAGSYQTTSQIVMASDHSVELGAPLTLSTTVDDCALPVYDTTSHEGFNTLNEAMADVDTQNGDTLKLNADLVAANQQTITKSVTVDGNSKTITAGFTKTDNDNNSAIGVQADDVTIKNLTVDGTGSTNLHGINVYESTGININDTTIKNFKSGLTYGLLVNSSEVTVNNLTTSGNFAGVDIDQKTSASAQLTVDGVSHHNDAAGGVFPGFGIYVDDTGKDVTVVDSNNQYHKVQPVTHVNDAGYVLNPVDTTPPAAPTNLSWKTDNGTVIANNGVTNESDGTALWQDPAPSDVDHYVYKYWNDISGNQWKVGHEWPSVNGLTVSSTSRQGSFTEGDGVHHFCVAAVDAAGNESSCSEFTITYDSTAPAAPTITAPNAEQWFNTTPIHDEWTAVTDASGIAKYRLKYVYDDAHMFGGVICDGKPICRDVPGGQTSRNHFPSGPPAAHEQGGVTIYVRAIDGAGNVGPWSAPVHYYYDRTAPDVAITGYTPSANVITPEVTATDANAPLTYVWTAADAVSGSNVTISDHSTLEPQFTVAADGVYAFTLTVTDPAGNNTTRTFTFTYTAPTQTINAANAPQTFSRSAAGTTQTPAPTPPAQTTAFTNVATGVPGATPQVLGARSTTPNDGTTDANGTVLGTQSATPQTSEAGSCSKLLGLCWYYWIPIVAVIVGVVYYGYTRSDEDIHAAM